MTLKEYMFFCEVSPADLASELGVTVSRISKLKHQKGGPPTLPLALKIEKATNGLVTPYDWKEAIDNAAA